MSTPEQDDARTDYENEYGIEPSGMICVEHSDFGTYLITDEDSGKDVLVQVDWDYPSVASTFGWIPCDCGDGSTDGTVDCPCGRTAGEMIESAREFLDDAVAEGRTAENSGYFNQD